MGLAASYDGIDIFGRSYTVNVNVNPRGDVKTATPGVNGLGSIDMGQRGGSAIAEGLYVASSTAALAAVKAAVRAKSDGRCHPLVTTNDGTFFYAKLDTIQFEKRVRYDAKWKYFTRYVMMFTLLRV